MDEHDATLHLQALADELTRREWIAKVRQRSSGPVLDVTNPREEALNESVVCTAGDEGQIVYRLPGGQTLGSAADIPRAADTTQHVLRSVGQ